MAASIASWLALCLPAACVSLDAPPAGQPVVGQPGQALVFGRIRMVDAATPTIEYSPFGFDPWDQPFFVAGPRLTLELRQRFASGGAFEYKAHPAPPIDANGSFFWLLSAGDYMLLGNPSLLGSKRYAPEETASLASFSVPASGGTIYLGTLIVGVEYGLREYLLAAKTGEAQYQIRSLRVADELERDVASLRERFPAIPEPVASALMRAE